MASLAAREAVALLQSSLHELESSKGSVASAVQRLQRAAVILGDDETRVWCEIQLGNEKYTRILREVLKHTMKLLNDPKNKQAAEAVKAARKNFEEHPELKPSHFSREEMVYKADESGGGYTHIGLVEERYADLTRIKRGNDGTLYKTNLLEHLNYVRRAAHERATTIYNRVAYSESSQNSLDIMKSEVDDKLLDFAPELAEKLMLAFRSVASNSPEEWSQALTSCRRFIEGLADVLYPPADTEEKGRKLGQAQYINRLWAFMDAAIGSESNKSLAKAHVDLLGNYLERIHKLTNKGVHTTLERVEAVKAVFHTYLLVADLLLYLDKRPQLQGVQPNIHTATLDELESLLGVSRSIAKEIVRLRVEHGVLTPALLGSLKGIGRKTVTTAEEVFSFSPAQ